jgi:hypothetical protein
MVKDDPYLKSDVLLGKVLMAYSHIIRLLSSTQKRWLLFEMIFSGD